MALSLDEKKGYIFRITHVNNVAWILRNGMHCANSRVQFDRFESIGNPELIQKRRTKDIPIPPYGTLSDYVPFYFTPHSPMLLNIKTGWGGIRKRQNSEIVIFGSSIAHLKSKGRRFVFSDRHAYLRTANFYSRIDDLDELDWNVLRSRDFRKDPNDPERVERYQAEALVHEHVPIDALQGIACFDNGTAERLKKLVEKEALEIKIAVRSGWYFQ